MIKHINEDILKSSANITCHSVNHQRLMGAGLAKQIKEKYPEVMNSYLTLCNIPFDKIRRNGLVAWCTVGEKKLIASIFGQDRYGTDRRHTDYYALSTGFETVRLYAEVKGYSVAIPYGIGAGLGGGEWKIIMEIIHDVFKYSPDVKVEIYKLPLDK